MSTFGTRLRELRLINNLTQEKLGKLLGKSKNNISQYERNVRQADDETKKQLVIIFNVSMDYLMGISDIKLLYDDIKKEIELTNELTTFIDKIRESNDLLFYGSPMDKKTKNILLRMLNSTKEMAEELKPDKND